MLRESRRIPVPRTSSSHATQLPFSHSFVVPCLLVLLALPTMAQQPAVVPDTSELSIRPYGSFRGHMALYNEALELQQNGSRVGFEIRFKVKKVTYFATSELAINMFRNDISFSASASTNGGFLTVDQGQANQVFATRLGYIGADLGKCGQLTVGKQWGAYYDVSGYTDRFNVFGGQASNSYNGGTDGGLLGTGRADQAVVYRNKFGPVSFAGQLQFRSVVNEEMVDNYGGSVQVQLTKGLKVGGAI
ncbi:MAG: porin [Flavobacteriales bacterium]|nr:porin [Flavobacteriales bacterium]